MSTSFNITQHSVLRENVNQEWAKAFCDTFFQTSSHDAVTHLRIGGKSILPDAAVTFGEHLAKMKNVHYIDLSDCISGQPEAQALEVLNILTSKLSAAFSGESTPQQKSIYLNLGDNALGKKGLEACKDLIVAVSDNLHHLILDNIGMAAETAKFLVEIFENTNTSLRTLHVYNNMMGDEGGQHIAKIISKSPQIQNVRVSANRFVKKNGVSAGGLAIAEALAATSSLVAVDLSDNSLGLKASQKLGEALAKQTGLKSLSLADVGIDDKEFLCIVEALKGISGVSSLDFSSCELGKNGATYLAAILASLKDLEKLSLNQTEIGNKGALILANAFAKSGVLENIKEIALEENEISAKAAVPIAEALAKKKKLTMLKLNTNQISEEAREKLQDILSEDILGSLSDNEEEGESEEEEEDEDADELSEALSKLGVNN